MMAIENPLETTSLTVNAMEDTDSLSLTASSSTSAKYSEFRLGKYDTAFVMVEGVKAKNFKSTQTKKGGKYTYVYTNAVNIDAEKGVQSYYDALCWAATGSNMYVAAGWNTSGKYTFQTEDNVLTYFTQYTVVSSSPDAALAFLFYGQQPVSSPLHFSVMKSGGGRLHADASGDPISSFSCFVDGNARYTYRIGDIFPATTRTSDWGYLVLQKIDEYLKKGYTAGLGFGYYTCDSSMKLVGSRNGGHAITIVGVTYDESKKGTPEYYTGVIVADSDDDRTRKDPENSPNRLKILGMTWSPEQHTYYFTAKTNSSTYTSRKSYYGTSCQFLEHFTLLEPAPVQTDVSTASYSNDSAFAAVSSNDIDTEAEPVVSIAAATETADPVYDTIVKAGETFDVSGFEAYSTQVLSGGTLTAGSGAYLQNTSVSESGIFTMSSDAKSKDAAIAGEMILNDRAMAENTDVWGSGVQRILGGTSANNFFRTGTSSQIISGGDSYSGENTFYGGSQVVSDYAMVSNNLFVRGTQTVTDNGFSIDTELTEGAVQIVKNGGTAINTIVGENCVSDVQAEGIMYDVEVKKGGTVKVENGCLADATFEYGSNLIIGENSGLEGVTDVAGSITVNGDVYGIFAGLEDEAPSLVFNLALRSFDDDFMVNDLSRFKDISFEISLDNVQEWGTYKLAAAGASSVNDIFLEVKSGEFCDYLSVGDSLEYGRYTVSLSKENDALYFTVDNQYSAELKEKTVSGNGATLYSKDQQFAGGDWDDKKQESCVLQLEYDGFYQLTGDFGDMNGTVTVRDENGKKAGTGKIKDGELSMNQLLLAKETQYTVTIKDTGKSDPAVEYTLGITGMNVFAQACTLDDWDDLKTKGADGHIFYCDEIEETGDLFTDWVGFGDVVDYTEFVLESATRISFDVASTDKLQFNICELKEKTDRKGNVTYSLKTLQKNSLKADDAVTTKGLLLEAGTYYMEVKSTNAAKGGDALYSVGVNENTEFYLEGDNTDDTLELAKAGQAFCPWEDGETILDWVGYGDSVDYFMLNVEKDSMLELALDEVTADAVASKQLKLTCFDANGKKVALGALNAAENTVTSKKTLAAGEYYLGVTCTNEKKYETAYEISLNMLA